MVMWLILLQSHAEFLNDYNHMKTIKIG